MSMKKKRLPGFKPLVTRPDDCWPPDRSGVVPSAGISPEPRINQH